MHASQHVTSSAKVHPPGPAAQRPAALLYGPGHIVVHGNLPFRMLFGAAFLGLPAAEALLDLPRAAFDLMDLVYREGRPLALSITMCGAPWRLTIAERRDIGTGEVYGIALHLVPQERADAKRPELPGTPGPGRAGSKAPCQPPGVPGRPPQGPRTANSSIQCIRHKDPTAPYVQYTIRPTEARFEALPSPNATPRSPCGLGSGRTIRLVHDLDDFGLVAAG